MRISEKGKQLIKSYEGCRLTAYKCPAGAWTIGWGRTSGVFEGMQITQQQADDMFNEDVKRYEVPAKYGSFNQNQFDALTSFAYNCGMGALDDVLTSGYITDTMSLYRNGGGVVLPGLVRRRAEEVELYNTPVKEEA
ncbi:MAG: lysozyme, partial [Clostridium sp.]